MGSPDQGIFQRVRAPSRTLGAGARREIGISGAGSPRTGKAGSLLMTVTGKTLMPISCAKARHAVARRQCPMCRKIRKICRIYSQRCIAAIKALYRRSWAGFCGIYSGCHWTPTMNRSPVCSIACVTPRGSWATIRIPSPGALIDW